MKFGDQYVEIYSDICRPGAVSLNGNMFGENITGGGTGVTRTADPSNLRVTFDMGTGNGNSVQFYDHHDKGENRATYHKIQLGHDTPTASDAELQCELRYNNHSSTDFYALFITPTPATHGRTYKWELIKYVASTPTLLASSDDAVTLNAPIEILIYRSDDGHLRVMKNGVGFMDVNDTTYNDGIMECWFRNSTANGLTCYRYKTMIYRKIKIF